MNPRMTDYRGTLNDAQLAVLRWIEAGCPPGVMEGYAHRVSAAALRSRDLVKITGRGKTWKAVITPAGRECLDPGPPEPEPSRGNAAEQQDRSSLQPPAVSHEAPAATRTDLPAPTVRAARLSKTEQLIVDLIAADGVLRVPIRHGPGEPNYQQRIVSAQRYGKVPAGQRIRSGWVGGELEIRLEDAPSGTDVEARPVPVPARIAKGHPVTRRFRDTVAQHEVSRAALPRAVRIVQALVVDAERRGFEAANVIAPEENYQRSSRSGATGGHISISADGHHYPLRITEEGVQNRGAWQQEADYRAQWPHGGRHRAPRRYDAEATGRLTITIDGGYSREGRPSSFADRRSWSLEEKLPDVLREIEIRIAEDNHRRQEAERRERLRQREWDAAMERARALFAEDHRAKILHAQVEAWRTAHAILDYCSALEESHGEDPAVLEWIE
jgi:hypothetical protein